MQSMKNYTSFDELRKKIILGHLEGIKINKAIHASFKGHPVFRRFAIEAHEAIKWNEEMMISFSKLKQINP